MKKQIARTTKINCCRQSRQTNTTANNNEKNIVVVHDNGKKHKQLWKHNNNETSTEHDQSRHIAWKKTKVDTKTVTETWVLCDWSTHRMCVVPLWLIHTWSARLEGPHPSPDWVRRFWAGEIEGPTWSQLVSWYLLILLIFWFHWYITATDIYPLFQGYWYISVLTPSLIFYWYWYFHPRLRV